MMETDARPLPLLAGLIGWPVPQSKSPLIHEFWLKRLGIDGHYVRLPVRPGEVARAFRGMVALGFAGVQATMPHKRACFDLVDHHTPAAKALGAVNTVIVEPDGSLTGENTDVMAMVQGQNLAGEQNSVSWRSRVFGSRGAAGWPGAVFVRSRNGHRLLAVPPRLAYSSVKIRRLGSGIAGSRYFIRFLPALF